VGIISVFVFGLFLVALLIIRSKLSSFARDFESDDPERLGLIWASRICLLVVLIAAVGIVDSYVWKIPNPFAGPTAGEELPREPEPPPPAVKPDVQADDLRPDMDQVRDEHREQLDEFERDAR
jgi:hypothetical protein